MDEKNPVGSISIVIEASSAKAEETINNLVGALQRLKSATAGFGTSIKSVVAGINSLEKIKEIKNAEVVAKQLEMLKRAANGFSNNAGENLVLVAAGLKSFSGLNISKSLAENFEKLAAAVRNIHEKDAKRLSDIASSMSAIASVPSMARSISQINRLPEALARLKEIDIPSISAKMRELADATAQLAENMDKIGKGFGAIPSGWKLKRDTEENKKEEKKKEKAEDDEVTDESKVIEEKISLLKKLKEWADRARESLKKALKESADPETGKSALRSTAEGIGAAIKGALGGVGKFIKEEINVIKSAFKVLGKVAQGAMKLIAAGAKLAAAGLKTVGKTVLGRVTKPFRTAIKAFNSFAKKVGSVLIYRAIRSAIKMVTDGFKEGTNNLYQYSKAVGTSFAPAMDKLATSALYLKNSLGAMVAPIIEAIAPAVDMLVDKFVELTNSIGKTFAALTGKDVYSQAVKYPVEYAEAAEDATKKTKEFKKFLLGIDELNIMPEEDKDKDSLSDKLKDYKSMFKEVQVPLEKMDFAKRLREAIENGDWRGVGGILAEKLNSLVDGLDFEEWGKKLGEIVTNGLNIAYGFFENFEFFTLGKKVAEGFNSLFDAIDFDVLGRVLAQKWNALFDLISGLATSLEWENIGLSISSAINGFLDEFNAGNAAKAISEFVVGIFDALNTAITNTNWNVLGENLGQFLNNIDWYGIVYGALSMIANAINALKEAIDSFLAEWDWEETARQLYTAVNEAWGNVDWPGVGKTLADLLVTAFKFAFEFLAGIDWMGMAGDLLDALKSFVGEIGEQLGLTPFTDKIIELVDIVAGAIGTIVEKTQAWLGTIDLEPAAKAFDSLLSAINPLVETIGDGLAWAWENILLPLGSWVIEDAGPEAINFLTAQFNMLNDVLKVIGPAFLDLWNNILKPLFSMVGSAFIGILKTLSQVLGEVASAVQSFIDLVGKAVTAVSNFFTKKNSVSSSASLNNGFGGAGNSGTYSARSAVANAMPNVRYATINAYANGGIAQSGEIFLAKEKGPELVGKIGQKTGIMNNDQIVTSVSDGVRDANMDVMNAVYAIGSMIVKAIEDNNTEISLDGETLARKMQPYQNRLATMQGTSLVN